MRIAVARWRTALAVAFTLTMLAGAVRGQATSSSDVAPVLQRQTQELMDAIAAGNHAPWDRYLLDQMVYTAEDGAMKTKAQLLEELKPMPADIWGRIRVVDFHATLMGTTAIATYISDEDEGYFGQTIHARYRSTDTWIRTGSGWRLLSSQVLALRDDPPAITLPAGRLDEYAGSYALTPAVSYIITRQGDRLVGQRTGRQPEALRVEVADCLFVPGQARLRKIFQRDADGHITGFVERRETWDIAWKKK